MDEESLHVMQEECELVFSNTLKELSNIVMLRPLSNVFLQRSNNLQFDASIKIAPTSNVLLLTVSKGVYVQFYDTIKDHHQLLSDAVFPADMGVDVTKLNILDTLFDLSFNFVLQHELNHILCGHLDYQRATKGVDLAEYAMSESLCELGGLSDDILRSYYLEVEADGTAIEWMLERLQFKQLNNDLNALLKAKFSSDMASLSIMDLPRATRDIGFRYLLVSVWLVICLMESNRSESVKEYNITHPLPAARLISAINILMLYYAKLSKLRIPDSGEMWVSPSSSDTQAMQEYLTNVVKPVIKSFAGINPTMQKFPLVIPYGGSNYGENLVNLLMDVKGLLKNEGNKSEVMIQVSRIESVRSEILEALEEFRYMEGMRKNDSSI